MRRQDREIKQLAVDKPIVNSPYEEPMRYWLYEDHQPKLIEGMRRQAGYYFRPRTRGPKGQMSLIEDEQFVPLELVNDCGTRSSSGGSRAIREHPRSRGNSCTGGGAMTASRACSSASSRSSRQ